MKLCPKCGKYVDMGGTEWTQLFIDRPLKWSPVCHPDCAVELKKDLEEESNALPVVP